MADELALIESFSKSRLWKWTRDYLVYRREQLFQADTNDVAELWKNKGAILEVNRLLKAPQLVLEYYRRQQLRESAGESISDSVSAATANRSPSEFPD